MSKQNNVGAGPVSARNKQKGITLIALIITIIVMLILVGVTVSVSLNGGLFSKAKEAGNKTIIEAEKDMLRNLALGALDNKGKVNFADLKIAVDANGTFEEVAASNSMGVYASKKIENQYYTVKSDGTIIEGKTEIPTGKWTQNGDTLTYVGADGVATDKTLTIGDYVNYDEGTTGSYTTDASKGTGISYTSNTLNQGTYTVDGANGTIVAGDLSWVVLGVNEAGQVELISKTQTTGSLTLYGEAGFKHAVTEGENLGTLDTFCNNLYGKGEGALSARSLALTDIDKLTGYDLTTKIGNGIDYTIKYYHNGTVYHIKTSQITDGDEIAGWNYPIYSEYFSSAYTPDGIVNENNPDPLEFTSYHVGAELTRYPNLEGLFWNYGNELVPGVLSKKAVPSFVSTYCYYNDFLLQFTGGLYRLWDLGGDNSVGGNFLGGHHSLWNGLTEYAVKDALRPVVSLNENVEFTPVDSDSDGIVDYYDI